MFCKERCIKNTEKKRKQNLMKEKKQLSKEKGKKQINKRKIIKRDVILWKESLRKRDKK